MKQKRKVSAAAAESAGASWGSVTSRSAPQRAGAEHRRGLGAARVDRRPGAADDARHDGDVEEDVRGEDRPEPALVARRGAARGRRSRRRPSAGRTARARAPARASGRGTRNRPIAQASGSPAASVSSGRGGCLPGREPEQAAPSRRADATRPPPEARPRSRIAASGKAKNSARKAAGTASGATRARRASAQDDAASTRRSSGRGCVRSRPRAARAGRAGRRRSGGTRPAAASRRAPGSTNMLSGIAAWKRSREHEVDQLPGALRVLRARRARRRARPGGSSSPRSPRSGAVGGVFFEKITSAAGLVA